MKQIIIKTQAEFDALPAKFTEYTRIYIQNDPAHGRISVLVARENSSVEAWENSSVEAWGNSSVEAWGNSSVEAWENSSVVAWGNVGVHLQSDFSSVSLFMFSVCWALAKGKIKKKSRNATVIKPSKTEGTSGWLESQGVKKDKTYVILFKRVSTDWKTQEGTANETLWEPGKTLEHTNWIPKNSECGAGKFHACSTPYFCDEFRFTSGDKYVAIKIAVKDLHAWTGDSVQYPHKIAFRQGTVLYQCDRLGKKI